MADTSDAYGAFRNGKDYGSFYADFGGDYDAINSYSQGGAGGLYTVRGGETLEQIAYQLWGDSALWYKLAEANGLTAQSPLIEGRTLTIPAGVQRAHHNAGTVRPYDPAQALGDTSPTAAQKPKNNKCGVFGAIISAVVAVAASYVFGPVFGNLLSQGFNNIIGTQDGFSWKSLGISVLSASVSAGVGGAMGQGAMLGSQFLGDVVRGAASSAITQGIASVTEMQGKIDWAGVAAAGIGAGVGGAVTQSLSGNRGFYGDAKTTITGPNDEVITPGVGDWQWNVNQAGNGFMSASFGAAALGGTAGALANAATRSVWNNENLGRNIMAAIPDTVGQVLGGAIGRGAGSVWGDKDHTGVLGVLQDISEAPTKIGNTIGTKVGNLIESGVNDVVSLVQHGATVGAIQRRKWQDIQARVLSFNAEDSRAFYAANFPVEANASPVNGEDGPNYDIWSGTWRDEGWVDTRTPTEQLGALLGLDEAEIQDPRTVKERFNDWLQIYASNKIMEKIADPDTSALARQALRKFISPDTDRTLIYDAILTEELFNTRGAYFYRGYEENAINVLLKNGGKDYLVDGTSADRLKTFGGDWDPLDASWASTDGVDLPDVVGTFTYGAIARVDGNLIRFSAVNIMSMQSFGAGNMVPDMTSLVTNPPSGRLSNVTMRFEWTRPVPQHLQKPKP